MVFFMFSVKGNRNLIIFHISVNFCSLYVLGRYLLGFFYHFIFLLYVCFICSLSFVGFVFTKLSWFLFTVVFLFFFIRCLSMTLKSKFNFIIKTLKVVLKAF